MQIRCDVRPFVLLLAAFWFCLSAEFVPAQTSASATSGYDPRLTFAPLTLPDPVNAYRSSNGAPGPGYWQNEADYELHAVLDTESKQLSTTRSSPTPTTARMRCPACGCRWSRNLSQGFAIANCERRSKTETGWR